MAYRKRRRSSRSKRSYQPARRRRSTSSSYRTNRGGYASRGGRVQRLAITVRSEPTTSALPPGISLAALQQFVASQSGNAVAPSKVGAPTQARTRKPKL